MIRAVATLGGGIASSGGPCGALTGAVVFLGSLLGKATPEQRDNPKMWKSCRELYSRFLSEVARPWGSVDCRDITGIDWTVQDQVKDFYKGEGRIICADNTAKTAFILGEILEKYHLNKSL